MRYEYKYLEIILDDSSKYYTVNIEGSMYPYYVLKGSSFFKIPEYYGDFEHLFSHYEDNRGNKLTTDYIFEGDTYIFAVFNIPINLHLKDSNYSITIKTFSPEIKSAIEEEARLLTEEYDIYYFEVYCDEYFQEKFNVYFYDYLNSISEVYNFYILTYDKEMYAKVDIHTGFNNYITSYYLEKNKPMDVKITEHHIGYKDNDGNRYPLDYVITKDIELQPIFNGPVRVYFTDLTIEIIENLEFTFKNLYYEVGKYYLEQGYYLSSGYAYQGSEMFHVSNATKEFIDNYYIIQILNHQNEYIKVKGVPKDFPLLEELYLYEQNSYGDFIQVDYDKRISGDLILYDLAEFNNNPFTVTIYINGKKEELTFNNREEYFDIYLYISENIDWDQCFQAYDREGKYVVLSDILRNIYFELHIETGYIENYNYYYINGDVYYVKKGVQNNVKLSENHVGFHDVYLNEYKLTDIIDLQGVELYPIYITEIEVTRINGNKNLINLELSSRNFEEVIYEYYITQGYYITVDWIVYYNGLLNVKLADEKLVENYYNVMIYFENTKQLLYTYQVHKDETISLKELTSYYYLYIKVDGLLVEINSDTMVDRDYILYII